MRVNNGIAVYGIIRLWNLGARALAVMFLALATFGWIGLFIGLCMVYWLFSKVGVFLLDFLLITGFCALIQAITAKRPIFNKGDGWRYVAEPAGHTLSDQYIDSLYTKQEQEKFQAAYLKQKGNT